METDHFIRPGAKNNNTRRGLSRFTKNRASLAPAKLEPQVPIVQLATRMMMLICATGGHSIIYGFGGSAPILLLAALDIEAGFRRAAKL